MYFIKAISLKRQSYTILPSSWLFHSRPVRSKAAKISFCILNHSVSGVTPFREPWPYIHGDIYIICIPVKLLTPNGN